VVYPLEPLYEVDAEEAHLLGSFYEAKYDRDSMLVEFVKYLKERNAAGQLGWKVMFTEKYTYWPSGRLRTRELVLDSGEKSLWNFSDKKPKWSSHLDRVFGSWFSKSESRDLSTKQFDLAKRVLVCHELLSEIEEAVFETLSQGQRRRRWAFTSITARLPDFKDVVEEIVPESKPRVSFFAWTHQESADFLAGFDRLESPGALRLFADSYAESHVSVPRYYTAEAFDEDLQSWFAANTASSMLVMPIRALDQERLETAGLLHLFLATILESEQAVAVASVFRRFGHLLEQVIEMARVNELLNDQVDFAAD